MPNELKLCSGISTSNLVHPADHYAPLRTDPSTVYMEGQWTHRRFSCLAKAEEPTLKGGKCSLDRNHSVLSARTLTLRVSIDLPQNTVWNWGGIRDPIWAVLKNLRRQPSKNAFHLHYNNFFWRFT